MHEIPVGTDDVRERNRRLYEALESDLNDQAIGAIRWEQANKRWLYWLVSESPAGT